MVGGRGGGTRHGAAVLGVEDRHPRVWLPIWRLGVAGEDGVGHGQEEGDEGGSHLWGVDREGGGRVPG